MSLAVGIVGLPNVGKSTLFNALLKKQQALAANYPFATIEPNIGIVPVPDERLIILAEVIAKSREHMDVVPGSKEGLSYTKLPPIVPATVTFLDIAGLVKGASQGEGLGNQFLAHIRETNVICLVVRVFNDSNVVNTGSGDIKTDAEIVMMELILADIQTLAKQLPPKGAVTPEQKQRYALIQAIKHALDEGHRADSVVMTEDDRELIRDLCLLTVKPVIFVVNVGEAELTTRPVEETKDLFVQKLGLKDKSLPTGLDESTLIVMSAQTEIDIASLTPHEQNEYLFTLGINESGLERLIKAAYKALGLQSFLTAGEKEIRAWTIPTGCSAVMASGVIHTDFQKKFIKADVIPFEKFVEAGGWKSARDRGWVRSEGRNYVMQDGEVVEFKIGT